MNTRFNILIVSRSIPPAKGGSAFVVNKLHDNFKAGNCTLLGGQSMKLPLVKKEGDVIRCSSQLSFFGRGARFLKPLRWILYPIMRRLTINGLKRNIPSHVIGVYPDNFYLNLSLDIAEHFDVPFYAYFHNTYLDNRTGLDALVAKRIQARVFKLSKKVFTISDGLKEYLKAQYPELDNRLITLPHISNAHPVRVAQSVTPIDGKLKVAMFGNFNESNIDATAFAINALSEEDIEIHLFSHVDPQLLKIRGIDVRHIVHRGYLEEDEFRRELTKMECGLVTHGFRGKYGKAEYKTIFPTRMILHMEQAYPLVVVAPKDSFLSKYVRTSGCAHLIDKKNKELVQDAFAKVRNGELDIAEMRKCKMKALQQFNSELVMKTFIGEFTS